MDKKAHKHHQEVQKYNNNSNKLKTDGKTSITVAVT